MIEKRLVKKIVFVSGLVLTLVAILAQTVFLYFMQYGVPGAFAGNGYAKRPGTEQFMAIWQAFDAEQSVYSKFVFSTLEWWWMLPVLCALLMVWAGRRFSSGRVVLALFASVLGLIALFWSAYGAIVRMGPIV
ncbi:MAG: hypothetical protein LBJ59_03745 [Zoogloeaceae bacterium]|jgi:hypothetical protein|nr:hypothetical protein [Zoogloeaceae bacterium]